MAIARKPQQPKTQAKPTAAPADEKKVMELIGKGCSIATNTATAGKGAKREIVQVFSAPQPKSWPAPTKPPKPEPSPPPAKTGS